MTRTTLFRRVTWVLAIGVTIALLVLLELIGGFGTRFHDLVISQSEWTGIMAAREETEEDLIRVLDFDGQNLVYDAGENRWFYSLVEGSSTAYDPMVRARGDAAIKLVVLSEEMSEEMVERNETRKLMAYTDEAYRVYDLAATTLPLMSIEYEGDEITATEEKAGAMRLFDNREGAKQRVTISDADFHRRGGVTLLAEKPNLKMNLTMESLGGHKRNNEVSLLGMRSDDDWVLYAAEDTVNNVFSSNLWNETSAEVNNLGVHNGYEYKYIELLVNGEYAGLYALGYRPDATMMELTTDRDGEYDEYMFRKSDWGGAYFKDKEEWDEEIGTDGFSLLYDTARESSAWQILEWYFDVVTKGTEEIELKIVSDLKTTIDYHLFLNLVQAIDQVSGVYDKNYFLTFKKNSAGGYTALYTPWDLDVTLGREFIAGLLDPTVDVELKTSPVARLIEIGGSADLRDRYRELRMGAWSDEAMEERFDEYEKQIFDSGAYARNAERWDIETTKESQSLRRIRKYLLERLAYLDKYYGLVIEE